MTLQSDLSCDAMLIEEIMNMTADFKSFQLVRQSSSLSGGFYILVVHQRDVKSFANYYHLEKSYPSYFLEHCLHKRIPLPHADNSLGLVMLQCAQVPGEALKQFVHVPDKNQNLPFRLATFVKLMRVIHAAEFSSSVDAHFKDDAILLETPFVGNWVSLQLSSKSLQAKYFVIDTIHPRLQLQMKLSTATLPVCDYSQISAHLLYLDPQNDTDVVASLRIANLEEFIFETKDFLSLIVPYLALEQENEGQQPQQQLQQDQHLNLNFPLVDQQEFGGQQQQENYLGSQTNKMIDHINNFMPTLDVDDIAPSMSPSVAKVVQNALLKFPQVTISNTPKKSRRPSSPSSSRQRDDQKTPSNRKRSSANSDNPATPATTKKSSNFVRIYPQNKSRSSSENQSRKGAGRNVKPFKL